MKKSIFFLALDAGLVLDMSNLVQLFCSYGECDREFSRDKNEVAKNIRAGTSIFCSISCSSRHRGERDRKRKVPNVKCALPSCQKLFYKNEPQQKCSKTGLFFCCRAHKDVAQSFKGGVTAIQPPRYSTMLESNNYRAKAFTYYPHCCANPDCGYSERVEILQVHHLDRDRTNNTLNNLQILCPRCHDLIHFLSKSGKWLKRYLNEDNLLVTDNSLQL